MLALERSPSCLVPLSLWNVHYYNTTHGIKYICFTKNLQSSVTFESMVTQPWQHPLNSPLALNFKGKNVFNCTWTIQHLPPDSSPQRRIKPQRSLNGNLSDKPEELTSPPKGDESNVEHAQTHPSSRCLSKPLCIQATFSKYKIWYQHGLPPVSLCETELAGFLIARGDDTDCRRLLWCVCLGACDGLQLYTAVSSSLHQLCLFCHVSGHSKALK